MLVFEHFDEGDWFLLAAFCMAAIFSLLAAIRMFHRARLIEDMPTSKIRSAAQGYVELFGTAKWLKGPQIIAPLSGFPCVWYCYSIEERSRHGKQKWRRIEHGVSEHLFLLQDETGSCVIDPEGAKVTPAANDTWYGSSPARPPNVFKVHAAIDIISNTLVRTSAPYRYSEQRLHVDKPLYAMGEFISLGTDYRKQVNELARAFLHKLKRDKNRLGQYDVNLDGTIDQVEWELARKDAQQAALEEQLNNPPPRVTHVLKQPEARKYQPFLLSAKSESHLARNHRILSFVMAMLFIILVAGIFYKLFGAL